MKNRKLIINLINDELKKISDREFLITLYLFIQKFRLKGGN